jgi:hypothetical protein
MHPIQDLFLESFSYILQFDMHFYMHSYVDKNFILVKSECYMPYYGPSEISESYLPKWYSGLLEFQPVRDPKIEFMSAAVLSRMEFSSDVDTPNSVTSKPLSGQSCMGSR